MIADALIRYDRNSGENTRIESKAEQPTREQIHEFFLDKFEALENGLAGK